MTRISYVENNIVNSEEGGILPFYHSFIYKFVPNFMKLDLSVVLKNRVGSKCEFSKWRLGEFHMPGLS